MKLVFVTIILAVFGPVAVAQSDYEMYIERANKLMAEKKYEESLVLFDYAIQEKPQKAEAYYLKARAKAFLYDYEQAIYLYNQSLRLDNSLADAYFYRGLARQFQNDSSAALNDFNQALLFDQSDAQKYISRATILLHYGKFEIAIDDFIRAEELGENSPWVILQKAKAMIGAERYDHALRELESVKQTYLKNDYLYYELCAVAKFRLNQHTPAMRDFHKSFELNSNNYQMLLERAACRKVLGDHKGACKDLKLAEKNGVTISEILKAQICP